MKGKEIVSMLMKQKGITAQLLAQKLEYKFPSGVTERIRGKMDMRADNLAKFLEAMDCQLIVRSKLKDKTEWVITPTVQEQ